MKWRISRSWWGDEREVGTQKLEYHIQVRYHIYPVAQFYSKLMVRDGHRVRKGWGKTQKCRTGAQSRTFVTLLVRLNARYYLFCACLSIPYAKRATHGFQTHTHKHNFCVKSKPTTFGLILKLNLSQTLYKQQTLFYSLVIKLLKIFFR